MSRRPLISLAVLASALCTSVPLLTGTAHAADPVLTDGAVFTADYDGDFSYGVYRRLDGGSVTTIAAESSTTDVSEVTSSRDGGRIAYVQNRYAADGSSETAQIVVRDAGGALVRTVDPVVSSDANDFFDVDLHPALSPDGSELVFTRLHLSSTSVTYTLRRANLTTGAISTVSGGGQHVAWAYLTPQTLISIDGSGSGAIATLPVTGGSSTPVAGLDPNVDGEFTVSPDGTRIAWTHITSADTATVETSDLETADLTVTDGTATLANTSVATTGLYNHSPAWTRDGLNLRYAKYDGDMGPGDLWTVNSTGTPAPVQTSTPDVDETSVADVVVDDTAPAAAIAQPFVLAGTSARINWTMPTGESDLSGVSITRTGGTGTKTWLVPAPTASVVDTGLTVGTTYSYAIRTVDHSGNLGVAAVRKLTAIQPFVKVSDPTSTTNYTRTAFAVGLPTVGTYTIQYRANGGALTTWFTGSGSTHTFAAAKQGYSYGFYLVSRDAYGNASALTPAGFAVVPLDQNSAKYSGNAIYQSAAGRYLGSAALLRAAGASARLTVSGNRLQIVGERCTTCGVMDVYLDGVRVAGVDTHASTRAVRQVLYARGLTTGSHTLVVKARGTAGRPTVVLDGFAVRR